MMEFTWKFTILKKRWISRRLVLWPRSQRRVVPLAFLAINMWRHIVSCTAQTVWTLLCTTQQTILKRYIYHSSDPKTPQSGFVRITTRRIFICFFLNIITSLTLLQYETRGPRWPWNAHLRQKTFKSSLFSLLYVQQATPGRSKSERYRFKI